jgi:hypothetical protein
MTNKDKVMVAFLVSVGMFSTVQAGDYVKSLSSKEKPTLLSVTDTAPAGGQNADETKYPNN